jgi:hypothetical protein
MLEEPVDGEEHRSTDTPFTLDDVKNEDFEHFLWAIYNPYVPSLSCCPYSLL